MQYGILETPYKEGHKQTASPSAHSPLPTVRRVAVHCCGLPENFSLFLFGTDFIPKTTKVTTFSLMISQMIEDITSFELFLMIWHST